mmetsp:Transcript_103462/g.299342  ORF Transcript_103462/g.299342 Transcript_103462/m.299342 type:complete len:296 (+) Transcript_103462:60-947(+)
MPHIGSKTRGRLPRAQRPASRHVGRLAEGALDLHTPLRRAEDLAAVPALHLDGRLLLHLGLLLRRAVGLRAVGLAPHAGRLPLLDHGLLMRREHAEDRGVRPLIPVLLYVLDLHVLLGVHAAHRDHVHAVDQEPDLLGDLDEATRDGHETVDEADGPKDAVVACRVLLVETRLHHEAIAAQRQACAAACLEDHAIPVLWLAEGAARAEASAANIGLAGEVQELHALIVNGAAWAPAGQAELERRRARRLEEPHLPMPRELLRHLLLDRHLCDERLPRQDTTHRAATSGNCRWAYP